MIIKGNSVVSIMGPTGSGKTSLALSIYDQGLFDLVNVDSVQIYKGLDIGSGKLSKELLATYPHRLLDILDPEESYSVARFRNECLIEIKDSLRRDTIPILVGGTMLYFNSLVKGLSEIPQSNKEIREQIEKKAKEEGWEKLYERLSLVDPITALKVHKNDKQRIQRALEVFELTSKPLSSFQKQPNPEGLLLEDYNFIQFAIDPGDREELREKIKLRFLEMIERGLVKEVEELLDRKELTPNHSSMKSVGYRQVCDFLSKKLTYDEMINRAIISTRQLAKRQMTWLRGWKNIKWISQEKNKALKEINEILRTSYN